MSRSRRSSIPSNPQLPAPRSPSSSSAATFRSAPPISLISSKPSGTTAICTSAHAYARSPTSPMSNMSASITAVSTQQPLGRRSSFSRPGSASSSSGTPTPARPIPISPTSPSGSRSSAHRDRDSNLAWAIRHNDVALIRDERAAIARRQAAERVAKGLPDNGNPQEELVDDSSGNESFEIEVMDTSHPPGMHGSSARVGAGAGVVRYNTGRRMSSLATYTGLPSPAGIGAHLGGPASYSVNLTLGGGGGGRPSSSIRSASPDRPGFGGGGEGGGRGQADSTSALARRPLSPYRSSMPIGPLTSLPPASARRAPSPARGSLFVSPSAPSVARRQPSPARARAPLPTGLRSPQTGPRIIHGFDVPSPSSARAPSPSGLPVSHSISRGRAGSMVASSGRGRGNREQEEREQRASRDFQVLDGMVVGGGGDRKGRTWGREGKEAEEKLRRGYGR
ncbi:hypothetical protein JCM21900_004917 [Sporobolomyces salmonicolor]